MKAKKLGKADNFGETVKHARESLGLSRAELVRLTRIPADTLARIENGGTAREGEKAIILSAIVRHTSFEKQTVSGKNPEWIGRFFQIVLSRRNMTQREVAIKANISTSSLSRFLNGKSQLNSSTIQRLASILDIDLSHPDRAIGLEAYSPFAETVRRIRDARKSGEIELDLHGLGLGNLPETLGRLTKLVRLDLSNNQLEQLPEAIRQLEQLQELNLRNNRLKKLPEWLSDLKSLAKLNLEGNDALQLPPEIVANSFPSVIFPYHFDTRVQPLNEARLILLGNSGAGKTSLLHRLAENRFREEPATHGLTITTLHAEVEGEPVLLHAWDFGGQDIFHGTNQLFLTPGSLYLVVVTGRSDSEDAAEHWLQLIESFAASAPTIVVLNQIDAGLKEMESSALHQKFPFIRAFVKTSSKTNEGIDQLRSEINATLSTMPGVRVSFPWSWLRIRKELTQLQKDFITFAEYRTICDSLGETDPASQQQLIDVMNDLGLALTFRNVSQQYLILVLNAAWIINGIYGIMLSEALAKKGGEFQLRDLRRVLNAKTYPASVHKFIVEVMQRFDLCFPLEDEPGKQRYLVPEFLTADEPGVTDEFLPDECFSVRYDYDRLPPGLFPRFISRTHQRSTPSERWRNGVVLRGSFARALVKAGPAIDQVSVHVKGERESRRDLLHWIRRTLERLHADLTAPEPTSYFAHPDYPEAWFSPAEFEGKWLPRDVEIFVSEFALGEDGASSETALRADVLELSAREYLKNNEYETAWQALRQAIQQDATREARINAEFGFLFSAMAPDRRYIEEVPELFERVNWWRSIWQVLAERNYFSLPDLQVNASEIKEESVEVGDAKAAQPTIKQQTDSAEQKGDQLEDAVARLFRTFFQIGDDIPWKIRKQKRGTQGGYDLSIEWSGTFEVAGNASVRCHIECKNYKDQITLYEVGEKVLSQQTRNPLIEHWILISPRSNPANPLNDFLERHREEGTFPFEIQIWCPETGVDELFGLEPDVYDRFFESQNAEQHPKNWDSRKREAVRAKWRQKLEPPLRLPSGWSEYLKSPDLLCIHQEKPAELSAAYSNHVRMSCRNSAGALMQKPLDTYVDEWLAAPEQPVLFLLGEFGDGKSFFTYALARRLTEAWQPGLEGSWMPLRLALRTFPGNAREFLRSRLETFNASVGGWADLGKLSSRLIILDGFDEMSVDLDPATVTKNIKSLLSCLDEFNDCKILVTSRTHFFHNRKDAQRLLARAGAAPIYYLAPIGRSQVISNVAQGVSDAQKQELLRHLETMNDPIGLASKPLFLEMLKQVLSVPDLPKDLDTITLYERYIEHSLNRKRDLLDDPGLSLTPAEIIKNLRILLGRIAVRLQQQGDDYVLLRQLAFDLNEPFAQLLWQLSGTETLSEDAQSRVGARSLLGRVVRPDLADEWPVDFCHRSMREYFVAIQLCEAVEADLASGERFLREVPLNHEILEFAAERWRASGTASVKKKLLQLIERALPAKQPGRLGGYALTLLHRLETVLPRDFDWEKKVFDGADLEGADLSGLDFSSSSFRYANLANVDFENANFGNCDLTGVRIEQTAPVLALGRAPSGEHVLAAYSDGVIREWHLRPGRKTPYKVLAQQAVEPGCLVGVHEAGQPWLSNGREWMFFVRDNDGGWNNSGNLIVKERINDARAQPQFLVMSESDDSGGVEIVVVDLERQAKLCSVQTKGGRHFATLGGEALVWGDAEVGFRVSLLPIADRNADLILPCDEPSCLDTFRLSQGVYLVGGGTEKGVVNAWRVTLENGSLRQSKMLEAKIHDGVVTAAAIIDSSRLASGGSDCAIVISRWLDERLEGKIERKLQLRMRCRGLKIDGLKSEVEYALLSKLIEESEMV